MFGLSPGDSLIVLNDGEENLMRYETKQNGKETITT